MMFSEYTEMVDINNFRQRAEALESFSRFGSADAVILELNVLRSEWKTLSAHEQKNLKNVTESLARIAKSLETKNEKLFDSESAVKTVIEENKTVSKKSFSLEAVFADMNEEKDALKALQGIEELNFSNYKRKYYDGSLDSGSLLEYFGLDSFRQGQKEAIENAFNKKDSLVIMPTGGGKSLCYQIPGVASKDLTIVVSPLIALIADQYKRLVVDGHPVVMLASSMETDDVSDAIDDIVSGSARIVFCSPERFSSRKFMKAIQSRTISLFAIDEAHCLSEWGHDFRPDYLRLHKVIQKLNHPPVMAVTATATEEVAEEIVRRLQLKDPLIVRSGFDRQNLSFDVLPVAGTGTKERKYVSLLDGLKKNNLPAIVYTGTRKDVEEITKRLQDDGIKAVGYHGGMMADQRAFSQHQFMSSEADVVVATNAFGMGVDKANVRSVWHWAIPKSVEAYYQEAGRAGRDGKPAKAVLLASRADLGRLINFIKQNKIEVKDVTAYVRKLEKIAKTVKTYPYLQIEAPLDDRERICLGIAERANILKLEMGDNGKIKTEISSSMNLEIIKKICSIADSRNWKNYRAIESFASPSQKCRRRTLLEHFGDNTDPILEGRCCDVCDFETIDLLQPMDIDLNEHKKPKPKKKPAVKQKTSVSSNTIDTSLAVELREWRKSVAVGRPAYTVAHNAALDAIAEEKPSTLEELGSIKGVGNVFLQKYGQSILELVKKHS